MNCARLGHVLDAWIDGELDAATSEELRRHVAECSACAALEGQRLELSRTVRSAGPYYRAPQALRERAREILSGASAERTRTRKPTWPQAVALAACAAFVSAIATFWMLQPGSDKRFSQEIVASHVASMAQAQRLVAIESSERHSIRPWFQGKVDFSPAVKDLSDAGFVLLGGRLDHVGERQAAAVVYRIRKHVINLFVWRARSDTREVPVETRTRGFTVLNWTEDGLHYAAISDVDPRDLQRFADGMRGR